jgi:hypothetical protein
MATIGTFHVIDEGERLNVGHDEVGARLRLLKDPRPGDEVGFLPHGGVGVVPQHLEPIAGPIPDRAFTDIRSRQVTRHAPGEGIAEPQCEGLAACVAEQGQRPLQH